MGTEALKVNQKLTSIVKGRSIEAIARECLNPPDAAVFEHYFGHHS